MHRRYYTRIYVKNELKIYRIVSTDIFSNCCNQPIKQVYIVEKELE